MTRIALAAVAVLALSACSPSGDAGEPSNPPPPADAPPPGSTPPPPAATLGGVDLGQPVRLVGTEPFWGMDITPETLTLTGADRPTQSGPNTGPNVGGGVALWTVTTSDGAKLEVKLTAQTCSDGMSDRTYPLTAEVKVDKPKAETLKGCAASKAGIEQGGESGPVR